MSIIIKGMEKPKDCGKCPISVREKICGGATTDCPLIEIDEETFKQLKSSALIIRAIYERLIDKVKDSKELKAKLEGYDADFTIIDEALADGERRTDEL